MTPNQSPHPKLQQATTAMREERYEDALINLKLILNDRPHDEIALGMLASAYAELGMKNQARDRFDQILSFNPENPLARYQRGLLDFEDKQFQSALEIWQPMLDDPGDFMGHFHSALALMQLLQPEAAKPLLTTAMDRMPVNHPLQPETARLLDILRAN